MGGDSEHHYPQLFFALFLSGLPAVIGGALKCQIYYLRSRRHLVAF